MKIIQVVSHKTKLFGLSNQGLLYVLHTNDKIGKWVLCTEN